MGERVRKLYYGYSASIAIKLLSGLYQVVPYTTKLGFLAPAYRKGDHLLYSHHHEGRVWLIGRSYTSWSLRLNLVDAEGKPEGRGFCPSEGSGAEGLHWEYLAERFGEQELWEADETVRVECADYT